MIISKKASAGIKRFVADIVRNNNNKLYGKENLEDFWTHYVHNENQPDEIVYDINIFGGEYAIKKNHVSAEVYHTTFDGKYYGTDTSDSKIICHVFCEQPNYGWGLFVKGGHGLVLESWNKNKKDTLAIQDEWKSEFPSIQTFIMETERGTVE